MELKEEDLGEYSLIQILNGEDFWILMDELSDDEILFQRNRTKILKAFKEEKLYGLFVEESLEMREKKLFRDLLFCQSGNYLLPCLCIFEEGEITLSWTHSRARKRELGKKLIQLLLKE